MLWWPAYENTSHACDNATANNAEHLRRYPGLVCYLLLMSCLPLVNAGLSGVCACVLIARPRRRRWRDADYASGGGSGGGSGSGGGGRVPEFERLLLLLAISELAFQVVFGVQQMLTYFLELNQLRLGGRGPAMAVAALLQGSFFAASWCHVSRNWTVAIIAIYRYRMASNADLATGWLLGERPVVKAGMLWLATGVVNLPRLFEFRVVVCSAWDQVTHIDDLLYANLVYRISYHGAALFLFQSGGPVSAVLTFSCLLAVAICRQRRRSDRLGREAAARNRTVLSLSACFLLCEAPALLKVVDPVTTRLHVLGYATNFLTCLNSSLNLCVYMLCNRNFRSSFVGCWLERRLRWRRRRQRLELRRDRRLKAENSSLNANGLPRVRTI